jgi:MFS family permease
MATGIADFGAVGRAFGNRNYAIYTAGSTVTMVGLWVQRLGVGWLAWELTYSGFWLGAIAFADLFPAVVIGPFAGVLADRMDRLRLARACQWLSLLQTLLLFALTAGGHIGIASLMLLTLFLGCVRAVYMPVRLSLVPVLVKPDDVPAAIAISSLIFNLARFVGPALAGLIIAAWGVAPTFAFYGVTVIALLFAFSRLRIDRAPGGAGRGDGMLAQIAEGLHYTTRHGAIAPLLLLMLALSVLTRPVGELFPAFADVVFARGAVGLAWLSSAIGLGAVAGGVWLARRGSAVGLLPIALAGAGLSGLSLMLFTATDIFWIAISAIGLFGVGRGWGAYARPCAQPLWRDFPGRAGGGVAADGRAVRSVRPALADGLGRAVMSGRRGLDLARPAPHDCPVGAAGAKNAGAGMSFARLPTRAGPL